MYIYILRKKEKIPLGLLVFLVKPNNKRWLEKKWRGTHVRETTCEHKVPTKPHTIPTRQGWSWPLVLHPSGFPLGTSVFTPPVIVRRTCTFCASKVLA